MRRSITALNRETTIERLREVLVTVDFALCVSNRVSENLFGAIREKVDGREFQFSVSNGSEIRKVGHFSLRNKYKWAFCAK